MKPTSKSQGHYLRDELYERFRHDSNLLDFLQLGSLDGLWYWDLEKPENEWMSPEFWSLLGYDYRDKKHLASEWQSIINQDDLVVAMENFSKHCDDPTHAYDQVVRYTHKDGSTIWVRCRGVAIRDENGTPVRLLGAHTDITHLKHVEEELREKTKELKAANKKLKAMLSGLLPICSCCKSIRDDKGYWNQIEAFLEMHSDIEFTHSLCPDCEDKLYSENNE